MTNTPKLSKHQEWILQYATMQTMLWREVSFEQKLDEYIETQIALARKEWHDEWYSDWHDEWYNSGLKAPHSL